MTDQMIEAIAAARQAIAILQVSLRRMQFAPNGSGERVVRTVHDRLAEYSSVLDRLENSAPPAGSDPVVIVLLRFAGRADALGALLATYMREGVIDDLILQIEVFSTRLALEYPELDLMVGEAKSVNFAPGPVDFGAIARRRQSLDRPDAVVPPDAAGLDFAVRRAAPVMPFRARSNAPSISVLGPADVLKPPPAPPPPKSD